MKGQVK